MYGHQGHRTAMCGHQGHRTAMYGHVRPCAAMYDDGHERPCTMTAMYDDGHVPAMLSDGRAGTPGTSLHYNTLYLYQEAWRLYIGPYSTYLTIFGRI